MLPVCFRKAMSEPAALLGADESSWLLTTDGLRERREQLQQGKRKLRKAHPLHDLALLSPCAEGAPPTEDPLGSPEKVVFGMALRKTRSRRLNQVFSPRRNAKTQAKRREVQGALAKRVVPSGPAQALPMKLQAHRRSEQRSPRVPTTSVSSSPGLSTADVAVQQRRALRAVELAEAGLLLSPLSGAQAAVAEALKEWDVDHAPAPALIADASDLVHTMQCSEEGSGQSAAKTAPAPTSRWTAAASALGAHPVVAASALGVAALLARRIR
jgi:hypothetical protein